MNSAVNAAEIWSTLLPLLEEQMTPTAYKTWFSDVEPVALTEDQFYLCCATDFKRNVLKERYQTILEDAFYELFSSKIQVVIIIPEEKDNILSSLNGDAEPQNRNVRIGSDLYTFDTFVVGESNRFAYNAAQAVAAKPGGGYNPLFIYGESGLGKTHLLYAIYYAVHKAHPEYNIVFVKGEQFTNEVTEAIRYKTTDQLRAKYRDKDMLLVDDIQFIAGKQATQVEFFNTFNDLHESGHQIVLTSDRPPSDMVQLEDRLRSRFEWGLMADIQPPDYETRVAIVQEKAIQMGLDLPRAVLEYIAENIKSNIRQIEGTVRKLLAFKELEDATMDSDTILRAVRDLIRNSDSFTPSPEIIIEETAKCYGVEVSDIMSTSRTAKVTLARQISMYIIRSMTTLSLPDIGRTFGRDHTTVMHSLEKVEKLMKSNREVAENIRDIKSNVNAKAY
jgi:chromosomal replication initiator protein